MEALSSLDSSALALLTVTLLAFLIPILLILPPVPPQPSDGLLQTHSKAGLAPSRSQLRTQFSTTEHGAAQGQQARVQSVMVHPVKSCRPVELSEARLLPRGLEFDRVFMLAQLRTVFPVALADAGAAASGWEFISQRQFPLLATVAVDLWLPDAAKTRRAGAGAGAGPGAGAASASAAVAGAVAEVAGHPPAFLVLRFPWQERGWRGLLSVVAARLRDGLLRGAPEKEVLVPLDFPTEPEMASRGYEYGEVRIWKDTVRALDMSPDLPAELRLYLGVSNKLALFRLDPAAPRHVASKPAGPDNDAVDAVDADAPRPAVTAFQDAYPLHIQNLSTMQHFSTLVPKDDDLATLDVRRFRPNIISAYVEESWKRIRLGRGTSGLANPVRLRVARRTVRCRLPNVDPDAGARHATEPDRSLRRERAVDAGAPSKGCLGMQAAPIFDDGDGDDDVHAWVAVGMTVEVEERGTHSVV